MAESTTTKTNAENIPDEKKEKVNPSEGYFGRKVIKLDADSVTDDNVVDLLNQALLIHEINSMQINYLWNYYKGKQPILGKIKDFREDINNKIVVNRANEIVTFWTGFLCSAPIKYVVKKGSEDVSIAIEAINDMMNAENKDRKDTELITWLLVCGTAYRYCMSREPKDEYDSAPFEIETLDPRSTLVAYSNRIGHKQLLSCTYWEDEFKVPTYGVYTDDMYYEIKNGVVENKVAHFHGRNPIVEYPANFARLGVFEVVLSLIDAGNAIESDRQDGLEQFIQGFIKFVNCEITEEELKRFLSLGAIMVNGHEGKQADVDYVATDLSQTDTQVMSDNIYNMILTICGMPNRNGGNSTSDTGSAVIYRDGWQNAESRALAIENMFKGAEIQILKVLLKILKEKTISGVSDDVRRAIDALSLNDIDIQFTRRNTSNLQSKVQVLIQMLSEPKVHPRLAYEISDLFTDPENAYKQGMEYYEETLNSWNIDEGSGDKKITSEEDI